MSDVFRFSSLVFLVYISMREISPNPDNGSLEELEIAHKSTADRKMMRRLLAIKMLFLGVAAPIVAATFSVDHRTLHRWIERWNTYGLDGLATQAKASRSRALTPDQEATILDLLSHPKKGSVTHWTGRSLHGYLQDHHIAQLDYSTLIRFVHTNGFSLLVPHPQPVKQDMEERQ